MKTLSPRQSAGNSFPDRFGYRQMSFSVCTHLNTSLFMMFDISYFTYLSERKRTIESLGEDYKTFFCLDHSGQLHLDPWVFVGYRSLESTGDSLFHKRSHVHVRRSDFQLPPFECSLSAGRITSFRELNCSHLQRATTNSGQLSGASGSIPDHAKQED